MFWNKIIEDAQRAYGRDYYVPEKEELNQLTRLGTPYLTTYLGRQVFLPSTLYAGEDLKIDLICSTIKITGKKSIVSTPLSERKGTVKEMFTIGDYEFEIEGMLIATDNRYPDDQVATLRDIYETAQPVELHNAIADFFLQESKRVCISELSFYDDKKSQDFLHVPYKMKCLSDCVETLELD